MDQVFANFEQYLILGLLLALFFKESLTYYVNSMLGLDKREEIVPDWGKRLIEYANHNTTERLEKLIEMEEKEHQMAGEFRDVQREILWTIKELSNNCSRKSKN